MTFCCKEIEFHLKGDEIHFNYHPDSREYSIPYKEGYGGGVQLVHYCPWCGTKLPISLGDTWFDTLRGMGFDDPCDQEIPPEFKTDEWWKERNL